MKRSVSCYHCYNVQLGTKTCTLNADVQDTESTAETASGHTDDVVVCYDLMGVVSYVEEQTIPGHLVAHILPGGSDYTRKKVGQDSV